MIKLFVCTFMVYNGDDLDQVDSLIITALDQNEAENHMDDFFEINYPDQEVDYKVKLIDRQVYSKVFIYENMMRSGVENVN